MDCEVSIIIPVYNCEKYLDRCIISVLKQSYQNFELILIDDGSKDASADIVKKYLQPDRVIGVFQDNQGVSAARNAGMKIASKEYIMFIDADDYIESNYVEEYIKTISGTDFDIVMGGFTKVTGEHVEFVRRLNGGEFSKYVVGGPVAKIYLRKFLEDNNITFPKISESEDVYFNMTAISKNAKIGYTNNTGYYYYYNPDSISNTLFKGFSDEINILSLADYINFEKVENHELHQYFIMRYIIWYLLYTGKGATKDKFMSEYKKYFLWIEENIPNYKWNKAIKPFGPKGEQPSVGLITFIFMLLHRMHLIGLFASFYCKGKNDR